MNFLDSFVGLLERLNFEYRILLNNQGKLSVIKKALLSKNVSEIVCSSAKSTLAPLRADYLNFTLVCSEERFSATTNRSHKFFISLHSFVLPTTYN